MCQIKGFGPAEKLAYRTQIYENVLKGMAGLINGKKELKLPWRGNIYSSTINGQVNEDEMTDHVVKMKNIVNQFTIIYKHLMEEREREAKMLQKTIHIQPEQFGGDLIEMIEDLWADDAIREAYERRREFPRYFVENVPYFIKNLGRLSDVNYDPNSADILRCRRATTNINEIEMDIKNVPFRY